jgi:hypothetical protein
MNDVLTFPQKNQRRIRKSRSIDAAGLLSLMVMERDGETVPDNVERFDRPGNSELPGRSAELLLATFIWQVLTAEQQDRILSSLRHMAYRSYPDQHALQIYNLLMGKL